MKNRKDNTLLGVIVFILLVLISGLLGVGPLDVPILGQ